MTTIPEEKNDDYYDSKIQTLNNFTVIGNKLCDSKQRQIIFIELFNPKYIKIMTNHDFTDDLWTKHKQQLLDIINQQKQANKKIVIQIFTTELDVL